MQGQETSQERSSCSLPFHIDIVARGECGMFESFIFLFIHDMSNTQSFRLGLIHENRAVFVRTTMTFLRIRAPTVQA